MISDEKYKKYMGHPVLFKLVRREKEKEGERERGGERERDRER